MRRAQGNRPDTAVADSIVTGIEQSHRRTSILKPALLGLDQLIDSAKPFAVSIGSVRKMAHTTPTIHVRKAA